MQMPLRERPPHLFVVEDDSAMRSMVSNYLGGHQLEVTAMASGEEMLRRMHRQRPDLVLLDVGLPGLSGLEVCRQLRADGDRLPVILLTARTEEIDRVLGLELGADDYLGKPFSPRELLARVRALLRRASPVPGVPLAGQAAVQIGTKCFERQTRQLIDASGASTTLSSAEYALLAEFVGNPLVPLSRDRLLQVCHGRSAATLLPRTIDVAVMRLRKLVEPDPAEPRYIQTARHHGYMFVPDPRLPSA
jgi:two-component system, OmpR family, phosphate regulon response regulator OmpR